jgi:hypothetical protein
MQKYTNMLGCLADLTAGLEALGLFVGLFSLKTAGLLKFDKAGQLRKLEAWLIVFQLLYLSA